MKKVHIYNKITHRNIKLRTQLLWVLVTVTLIPIISIGISTYISTIGKITELSLSTLKTTSYNTMNTIDVKINSIDSIIKGVSSQPDFLVGLEVVNSSNNMDTVIYSSIQLSMKNVVDNSNKLIETMYLCDKNGKIIITGFKNYKIFKNKNFYNMELFQKIKTTNSDSIVVGNPFYSEELKKEVIPITKTIKSLAGFSGSITALVNYISFFNTVNVDNLESEIMILDNDLNIIFHQDKSKTGQKITDKNFINQINKNNSDREIIYNDANVKKVLNMNKSSYGSWIVSAQMDYSSVMSPVRQYILVLSVVIITSLILALIISIIYSKHISKPVVELTNQMKKVEEGFLEIDKKNSNSNIHEINSLRKTFNMMVSNLNSLLSNISSVSKEIDFMTDVMHEATACSLEQSEQTQKSISHIDENIKKQADDTEYASQGIESLAGQIATSRELSQNVYSYLSLLNKSAENGKTQINNLRIKSHSSMESTNIMKEVIAELQSEMKQINTITTTIQNIAKQTKLLSLNASIEASRAGEAGRGFAIVAQEIKNLSEQTNVQASTIRSMIENIGNNTIKLNNSFKEVNDNADIQSKSVSETIDSFKEISEYIENISGRLYEITDYLQEMDSQKDNLVQLINEINSFSSEIAADSNNVQKCTQEQISSVQKVYDNSNVFNQLSKNLNASVENFKI